MNRSFVILALAVCLVVGSLVLNSSPCGREGWKGTGMPPEDVKAAVRRHCASGQKLPRLQKATPTWNAYSMPALKEACAQGQKEWRDAKGKAPSCTNAAPCTAAAVKRMYPCQHESDPSQCCKEDKSDCVNHQQVADAKSKEKVKCTGARPACPGGFVAKCKKKADGKSFGWMCCKNDKCYDNGDWDNPVGTDKGEGSDASGGKGVEICKDSEYRNCKTLPYAGWGNRLHNLHDHGFKDNLSSIKVPAGLKATVYDDTDGGGGRWTINGEASYPNLKNISHGRNVDEGRNACESSLLGINPNNGCWNDRVSAIRIEMA